MGRLEDAVSVFSVPLNALPSDIRSPYICAKQAWMALVSHDIDWCMKKSLHSSLALKQRYQIAIESIAYTLALAILTSMADVHFYFQSRPRRSILLMPFSKACVLAQRAGSMM